MPTSPKNLLPLAFAALLLSTTACAFRARPFYAADYEYASPPAYIEQNQTPTYYGGAPHYYYEGRWYRHLPQGGWGYYRSEPAELYRRRPSGPARMQAPAAPGGRIEAPPAYRR